MDALRIDHIDPQYDPNVLVALMTGIKPNRDSRRQPSEPPCGARWVHITGLHIPLFHICNTEFAAFKKPTSASVPRGTWRQPGPKHRNNYSYGGMDRMYVAEVTWLGVPGVVVLYRSTGCPDRAPYERIPTNEVKPC